MFEHFFILKCWEKLKATILLSNSNFTTPPRPPTNIQRQRVMGFPCVLIFHVEWKTYNSPPGLNFKLSLWIVIHSLPLRFIFISCWSSWQLQFTHICHRFRSCPRIPLWPSFSQAPNSQSPNSFLPRNCREEVGAWDWKPCFQGIWTTKASCSFLLLLWLRWPCRVVSLETDRDQCALVAMVRRNGRMIPPCTLPRVAREC